MARKTVLAVLVALFGATSVATDFGVSVTGPTASAAETKRPGLLQRLFGPRNQPKNEIQPRSSAPSSRTKRRSVELYSGYRTLCVRTCDGYYFPISFSASRSRFKTDETVCKAMYGGFGADLFIHNNRSPADKAVSLKGKRLASESYAFAFRQTFVEHCQAELKEGLARLGAALTAKEAGTKSKAAEKDRDRTSRLLPKPVRRPNPGIDPETAANRAGRFRVLPVMASPDAEIEAASANIRKLGSDYYYIRPIVIQTLRDPPSLGPEFSLISTAEAGPSRRMRAPSEWIDRRALAP